MARSQPPSVEVGHVDVERHVAHERDDARRSTGPAPRCAARFSRSFGRQLVEVGEDAVEVAVRGEQLGRRLLPHPGHAGQVVRGVAAQRGQQHVLRRRHAACARRCRPRRRARSRSRPACCRAPGRRGPATSWKLSRSPVTMTTSQLARRAASVARVAMTSSASKPGASTTGMARARHDLADHVELRRQQLRASRPGRPCSPRASRRGRWRPGGRRPRPAPTGCCSRMRYDEHGGEPVHRVGDDAGRGGQGVGQREVGPEGERHAVEQQQRARSLLRCRHHGRHYGVSVPSTTCWATSRIRARVCMAVRWMKPNASVSGRSSRSIRICLASSTSRRVAILSSAPSAGVLGLDGPVLAGLGQDVGDGRAAARGAGTA